MGNADFIKWLNDHNYTGTITLRLKEQYLLDWLDNNSERFDYISDLSEELFNIMISLDMDQYVNSSYDRKKTASIFRKSL